MRLLFASVLSVTTLACASHQGHAQAQQIYTPSSGFSNSFGSTPKGSFSKGGTAPAPRLAAAELIVQPDLIAVGFEYSRTDETAKAAHADVERRLQSLREAVKRTAEDVAVEMKDFRVAKGKRLFRAIARGRIVVPLVEDVDYWKKTEILTRLAQVTAEATEKVVHTSKTEEEEPCSTAGFSSPVLMVRDPEKHREELTARWVKRVHAFARAAETEARPLYVTQCAPPSGPVRQDPLSLEEVRLRIELDCGALTADAMPPPAPPLSLVQ